MKQEAECAVCAWRADCKMKFSYESSGLYCKEFTRDLTLDAPREDGEEGQAPQDTSKKEA